MLTPAEELGLSGLSLAGRVRKAFYTIPEDRLVEVLRRLREESLARRLVYLRDGQIEPVRVLPCPVTIIDSQRSYVQSVSLTIQNALKRLPELYLQDFAVRDVLRISPEEEQWLWECWGPSQRENNPVFGRLDAVVDFTSPMWKDSLKFVEPNMTGIGGLHMVPTCEQIMAEVVLPVLEAADPALDLAAGADIRELLIQDVQEHLEALGRPARNICFVEPKYSSTGPDEQQALAEYYHERYGLKIMHADPAELTMQGKEVCYEGDRVDLAYRDYSVADLMTLERSGVSVEPMRTLFRQNRVVSSIAAELDQKSCWEIFTDPQFTQNYFTADERRVFQRHILWTRILSDRKTVLPDGQQGDLLEYVLREREAVVLKPNRAYGGEGVVIGPSQTQADWEQAIERALADSQRYVVQQLATIPLHEFPVVDADGKVHVEPFYTVMGFAATNYGLAILGRASQRQVVNVAQRGGMCAVFTGRPPAKLMGPGAEA
jgi:hypothetical protein